jgi:Sec-independent protein translocase protein TatA
MGRGIREFRGSLGGEHDQDDVEEKRRELEESKTADSPEPVEGEVVTDNKA